MSDDVMMCEDLMCRLEIAEKRIRKLENELAIRNADDKIGKTCYKIYVTAERWRFPGTYWNYFCDTKSNLEYWKQQILRGGKAALYVKARPFTRSDRIKLGDTVFWTKEEAEEAIGLSQTMEGGAE